jgi:hypothetical protein
MSPPVSFIVFNIKGLVISMLRALTSTLLEVKNINIPTMPIITIFGATGTQGECRSLAHATLVTGPYAGSAVLEAVLADRKFTPRAVSRSLTSAASKALLSRGVEVVVGNLWNKDSVISALRGSYAVFGVRL